MYGRVHVRWDSGEEKPARPKSTASDWFTSVYRFPIRFSVAFTYWLNFGSPDRLSYTPYKQLLHKFHTSIAWIKVPNFGMSLPRLGNLSIHFLLTPPVYERGKSQRVHFSMGPYIFVLKTWGALRTRTQQARGLQKGERSQLLLVTFSRTHTHNTQIRVFGLPTNRKHVGYVSSANISALAPGRCVLRSLSSADFARWSNLIVALRRF